jgi:hypothetical protein
MTQATHANLPPSEVPGQPKPQPQPPGAPPVPGPAEPPPTDPVPPVPHPPAEPPGTIRSATFSTGPRNRRSRVNLGVREILRIPLLF